MRFNILNRKVHYWISTVPIIDLNGILASVQSVVHLDVTSWDDVNRLDVRAGTRHGQAAPNAVPARLLARATPHGN